MTRSTPAPALMAVLGIGLLSVMDGMIKYVAAGHATGQVATLRYVFGALAALVVFRAVRTPRPDLAMLRPHAWRGVVVAATAFCFFYALSVLPLAVVLALSFTAPIFIALFAVILLREKPGREVHVALVLGFAGVAVVLWDEIGRMPAEGNYLGLLAALASAITYALSMIALKSRAARDPVPTIVLLQNVFAVLLLAPLGVWHWTPLGLPTLGLFAVIGVLGTLGHLCLAWAYGRSDASRLGVLEYTAFVWAVLIGVVVFAEIPAPMTVAGAALIIGGALIASRVPKRRHEPDVEIGP